MWNRWPEVMSSHYNWLGSGVKMAAYSRSQLLLLLFLSVCLSGAGSGSVLGLKPASGPPNPPLLRAADPPARDAPAAAAGASQPRRATGWKLSEEEACREDLTRLCPKHTWTNNLAVLECLQDRREVSGGRMGVSTRWSSHIHAGCRHDTDAGVSILSSCISVRLRAATLGSGTDRVACQC